MSGRGGGYGKGVAVMCVCVRATEVRTLLCVYMGMRCLCQHEWRGFCVCASRLPFKLSELSIRRVGHHHRSCVIPSQARMELTLSLSLSLSPPFGFVLLFYWKLELTSATETFLECLLIHHIPLYTHHSGVLHCDCVRASDLDCRAG